MGDPIAVRMPTIYLRDTLRLLPAGEIEKARTVSTYLETITRNCWDVLPRRKISSLTVSMVSAFFSPWLKPFVVDKLARYAS